MGRQIAICFSGETRCYKSLETDFLTNLMFNEDDTIDIYIVTYEYAYHHIDRNAENNYVVNENTFSSLSPKKVVIRKISELDEEIQKSSRNRMHLTNHIKNIITCHKLLEKTYDIVIRARLDTRFYPMNFNLSSEDLDTYVFTAECKGCGGNPPDLFYFASHKKFDTLIQWLIKTEEEAQTEEEKPDTHKLLKSNNYKIHGQVEFSNYRTVPSIIREV